jgi:hypothetical protein
VASTSGAARYAASASTSSRSWPRNHGSKRVSAAISSSLMPASMARFTWKIRSGVGVRSAIRRSSTLSDASRSSPIVAPLTQPGRSISSARMPFWNASLNVRPMAIDSPTDFICVVSVASAVGNFSNAKRGHLTTT